MHIKSPGDLRGFFVGLMVKNERNYMNIITILLALCGGISFLNAAQKTISPSKSVQESLQKIRNEVAEYAETNTTEDTQHHERFLQEELRKVNASRLTEMTDPDHRHQLEFVQEVLKSGDIKDISLSSHDISLAPAENKSEVATFQVSPAEYNFLEWLEKNIIADAQKAALGNDKNMKGDYENALLRFVRNSSCAAQEYQDAVRALGLKRFLPMLLRPAQTNVALIDARRSFSVKLQDAMANFGKLKNNYPATHAQALLEKSKIVVIEMAIASFCEKDTFTSELKRTIRALSMPKKLSVVAVAAVALYAVYKKYSAKK